MTAPESIPPMPLMPDACVAFLRKKLENCKYFLEYGAGGSTMIALSLQVPQIQSVESDQRWLRNVKNEISRLNPPYLGSYIDTHVDIGPVGDWGYPTDLGQHGHFWRYPATPWRNPIRGELPDLVLIDGRFRVACFAMTYLHARPETTVLFDDYTDRDYYQVVERIVQPIEVIDRMAIFRIEGPASYKAALELLLPALQDPS